MQKSVNESRSWIRSTSAWKDLLGLEKLRIISSTFTIKKDYILVLIIYFELKYKLLNP